MAHFCLPGFWDRLSGEGDLTGLSLKSQIIVGIADRLCLICTIFRMIVGLCHVWLFLGGFDKLREMADLSAIIYKGGLRLVLALQLYRLRDS